MTNKKIPKVIMDKLSASIIDLGEKENSVPVTLKRTFNFKGRKSIDIASEIISALTTPQSLIADPFMGSGSFVFAAAKSNRAIHATELDNYTFQAVSSLIYKIDKAKFDNLFKIVKNDCFEEIMSLYETRCCGVENFIDKLHFDPETDEYYNPTPHRDIKDGKNIVLLHACPKCNRKHKKFDKYDKSKLDFVNCLNTTKFPSHKLIENSRINITASSGANKYDRNYTNRSKYALLKLQESINKLPECVERDVMEQCLVATLTLARISQYGSGSEYIYQVMRFQAQEKNVWGIFKSKCAYFLKFKTQYPYTQIDSNNNVSINKKINILNCDYRDYFNKDKCFEKFDLIYTDPPYTDQVAYLERSQMFRDWLFNFYSKDIALTQDMLNKEIIVSNSQSRPNKNDFTQYYNDIDEMFSNFYNVLKKDGVLVFTIKLGENKYFKTLAEYINLARKNGFEFALKFGIDKKDPTLRKQAAFNNTISKEMVVFFVKLDSAKHYWYIKDDNYDFEVVKILYNAIKNSEKLSLLKSECVKLITKDLLSRYDLLATQDHIKRIVNLIDTEFSVLPNALVHINPDNVYLELEESNDIFVKLYNTVPVIVRQLLDKQEKFTADDVYFEMLNFICNGDPKALKQILESSNYQHQIQSLIKQYCDIEGKFYIKKKTVNKSSEGATDISTLEGWEFEELVKKLLEALGYEDVIVSGQAGDRGIDVYAKIKEDGKLTGKIFQCKRWAANVGGTPIQRLHSMKVQLSPEFSEGICVTTSDYTEAGKTEAKNTGIQTINGCQLLELLNRCFPGEYYHGALNPN